ncbi:MAG: cyclic nucleotide-binding domain-containing protein [Ignavibacteriales bacterium]|nr:cyclic nucleotide-binding domain-containing protein [Ignavibacteriales bacterium]
MKKFPAGSTIIQQGTKNMDFFILMSGKIGVYKDGHKLAEYDEPGTVVGEISFILGTPRSATILCLADSELLEIEGTVADIVIHHPDIAQYVLINLAERLSHTTDGLVISSNKKGFKNLQSHVTNM